MAVGLIWFFIAIEAIDALANPTFRRLALADLTSMLGLTALVFGVVVVVLMFVSRGHNWARILLLAMALIEIFLTMQGIRETARTWWPSAAADVLQSIIALAALFLLFTPPGSRWYRKAGIPAG